MNIAPISAVTPEQFDREFNTNVRGLYFTVQKALPLLRNGGSIILNSSVANHTGSPGFSLYGGAKAAVRAFARSWSNDLKDRNIRVNSVSPGLIETPMAGKSACRWRPLPPTCPPCSRECRLDAWDGRRKSQVLCCSWRVTTAHSLLASILVLPAAWVKSDHEHYFRSWPRV